MIRLTTIRGFVAVGILLGAGCPAGIPSQTQAADEQPATKTWQGTWMNRKYNSSGPLKCVATSSGEGATSATFSGTFMRDPFSYEVTVETKQERNQLTLSGMAQLDGDKYEWTGYVRGKVLYGQFRSLKGHNGEFRLTETSK